MDKLFFPVNLNNTHWYVRSVCMLMNTYVNQDITLMHALFSLIILNVSLVACRSLVVCRMQEMKIQYYISVGASNPQLLAATFRYLTEESVTKHGIDLDMSTWELTSLGIAGCPQQANGYDCGVFLAMFMDLLSDDLELVFNQNDVTQYRRFLAYSIKNGRLDYPFVKS